MTLIKDRRSRHALIAFAFLAPNIIGFLAFTFGPVIYSFFLSFFDWNIFSTPTFVDLDNYATILFSRTSQFWKILYNTLYFMLGIPISLAVSLGLALLVNHQIRGITFFRTVYFLPVMASLISVALLWEWVLDKDYGLLNQVLMALGLGKVYWLGDPAAARPGIIIMMIWKSAGYNMLIYLAAMQGIPEQLYDAARIDGASRLRRFRHVTFPLLSPAHFFLLITGVIGTFQLFGPIYVMTQGGPLKSTWTLIFEIYWKAYQEFRMGYAAAVSWILFLLIFAITMIQWRYLGRKVHYSVG